MTLPRLRKVGTTRELVKVCPGETASAAHFLLPESELVTGQQLSKDLKALGRLVSRSFILELAFLLAFIINNLQICLSEILDFTF